MALAAHRRHGDRLQGRRRTRPQVQRAALPIPLPVVPTAAECAALLKALIKHLLFQRAQIPYLFDELRNLTFEQEQQRTAAAEEQQAAGRRRRRQRVPKADKRLLKFLAKAEEVMESIDAALRTFGVPARCFVLLGSSTAKPREAYEILLPPAAVGTTSAAAAPAGPAGGPAAAPPHQQQPSDVAAGQPPPPLPQHQPQAGGRPRLPRQERLCQLAVRQLVMAGTELPEGSAHTVPCKLFVLLEGGSSGTSSAHGGSTGMPGAAGQQEEEKQAAAPVPHGFAAKRQFKLSMRKGVHFKLLLGRHSDEVEEEEQQQQAGSQPSSGHSMGSSSMQDSQGEAEAAPTVHLSQLPDAASQLPGTAESCGQCEVQQGEQDSSSLNVDSSAASAGPAAGPGARSVASADTAGSVWWLCKTVLQGLNSHSPDDGSAAGFDGL